MNIVNLVGRIQEIYIKNKVCYIKIGVRQSRDIIEWISVTSFSTDFIQRNFCKGKWIGITGHIHINLHNGNYETEIIADNIYFVGNRTDTENQSNNLTTNNAQPSWEDLTANA